MQGGCRQEKKKERKSAPFSVKSDTICSEFYAMNLYPADAVIGKALLPEVFRVVLITSVKDDGRFKQ